ncbi:MAG: HNH endonuclease [Planctomycetes bacterium]|nr:HNH endonuclease [Planctomycetota bacterium]
MKGFIANTDFEWYSFLRERPDLEEINFWQPGGGQVFKAIEPGSLLFFKLKKPHYAIGGFGIFQRAEVLADWLAWECFGEGNGAATYEDMVRAIDRYRRAKTILNEGARTIGCIILTGPIFFEPIEWVAQPRDWKRNVVRGARYDLTQGEGKRILEECQARAAARTPHSYVLEAVAAVGAGRLIQPRLGQGTFRLAVTEAYDRACAVTGEHSLPVLEAAHIKPFTIEKRHDVRNGILLRSDLHRLFDRGYVTISPDRRFEVSQRLKDDFRNGKSYFPLHGRVIQLPRREDLHPDPEKLEWHRQRVYLG